MKLEPVYPKQDPEYRKQVMERFYKQVKNTNWRFDGEYKGKPRGRKPKKYQGPPPEYYTIKKKTYG
jgi:hypothetical protein